MKRIGKKAIISSTIKLVILVIALILLFFLIKNKWNVPEAFNNMLRLLRLK